MGRSLRIAFPGVFITSPFTAKKTKCYPAMFTVIGDSAVAQSYSRFLRDKDGPPSATAGG